jgi:hypothetical protein
MRRREYIAGGLGLGAVLAGGAYVTFGGGQTEQVPPTTVSLLEAPGSSGSVRVPATDRYTVLDLFSYTCLACPPQMENLRAAFQSVGERARFVSLHPASLVDDPENPTPVLEFWDNHGGPWPVGIDPNDHFHEAFGRPNHPFTAVIDPDGTVLWAETGKTPPGDIEQVIREGEA